MIHKKKIKGGLKLEFRGFIAIDLQISEEIKKMQNELKESGANLKIVKPENMHLTLKFLGNTKTSQINQITKILTEISEEKKPYQIKLKSIGVFPNKNYMKIIWVGVDDNGETKEIADEIDEKLSKIGFKKEKREFHPHLTLARVKSAKNKQKLIDIIDKYENHVFQESTAESIDLKQSELTSKGPIYTTLKKINL